MSRGFYYGSSNDTPWVRDLSWRLYVEKESTMNEKRQKQTEKGEMPPMPRNPLLPPLQKSPTKGFEDGENRSEIGSNWEGKSSLSTFSYKSGRTDMLLKKISDYRRETHHKEKMLLDMLEEEKRVASNPSPPLLTPQARNEAVEQLQKLTTQLEGLYERFGDASPKKGAVKKATGRK